MTRLEQIELREIRLPLKEPFRISSGLCVERRIMLLHLRDADGAETWSECVAGEEPNYTSETIDTAWFSITQYVAPRVLGVDFAHPSEVDPVLEKNFRGHNMAKAAIEMGMWGLTAVREKISLSKLLGGTREGIETGISLGIQATPEALVERAGRAIGEHYRKIKLKIQPGSDVEFVRAVRSAYPKAPLMADANNAYTLADTDRLKQLDDLDLIMIEQPLAFDDIIRHAQLQRVLKTPICLDESITDVEKAEDMISLGAGRIINIKPGRVGGFAQSRAIHDLCVKNKIPVWCGGMLESGVGRAYNVALASLPGFSIAGDLSPSARYWEQDVVTPEWTMSDDGIVKVPRDEPGIGITVDLDRVDALTVRTQKIGAK
ncbi:MAG: o-succinylbenzoate synthase [Gemmatimonadaceae bacterium]|nr:o-succinylbenzoate synthase [Gemmatimonadaceae bacterium]